MKIDTSSPVMVTGSTGYVGGVLVKQLLEAGLTVHCPVRDPTNESKLQHLMDLEGSERLKFFKADLLEKGSYIESAKNCSVVFHVASPFVYECEKGKEQEQLIEPALQGTRNVLESVSDPSLKSCVKRVVLTSSVNAIASDGKDCEDVFAKNGKLCDETTWNASASIDYQPYALSKKLAEQAAWKFVEDNQCSFDLAVCNPSFVLGPGVKVHQSAESYQFLKRMGGGAYQSGTGPYAMAIVDVRDVARGHIAAGFLPHETVAGERIILHGFNTSMMGVSQILSKTYPGFPFPKTQIPKWVIWCAAPLLGLERPWVSRNIGQSFAFDNSKSLKLLELGAYTPLAETLNEMFQQCVDNEYIRPPMETTSNNEATSEGGKTELLPNLHYAVSFAAIIVFLVKTYILG